MPDLYEISISSHFARTRGERCERLNAVLGGNWGKIICIARQTDDDVWWAVTDTGLFVILNKDKKVLVTCYLAIMKRVKTLYALADEHIPQSLKKRIDKNSTRYFKLYNEYM